MLPQSVLFKWRYNRVKYKLNISIFWRIIGIIFIIAMAVCLRMENGYNKCNPIIELSISEIQGFFEG